MPETPAPLDPATIDPRVETWSKGTPIVRVHRRGRPGSGFNDSEVAGRFRPIRSRGRIVPTMYGGDQLAAALAETVFTYVPVDAVDPVVPISVLADWMVSTLAPGRDLHLISLRGAGLRRLRTTAAAVVHSDDYARTAEWAEALYRWSGRADGLIWDSRRHPGSPALILFGTRVRSRQLRVSSTEPLWGGPGLDAVLACADEAGITIAI